jgi:transcriptional regulator of arginine metabolism
VEAIPLQGPASLRDVGRRGLPASRAAKRERQRQLRALVASHPVSSQHELVDLLAGQGFEVTQATVSRDIAELGIVKMPQGGRHVYAASDDPGAALPVPGDERLLRVLADYPLRIGRSGLTLVLVSDAGTAGAIAQAIDDSSLREQEGTLAGDNTVLVLFADEARLDRWRRRFEALARGARGGVPAAGRSATGSHQGGGGTRAGSPHGASAGAGVGTRAEVGARAGAGRGAGGSRRT